MDAFYKSFLRDGLGWLRGGGPRVHLAAFGKHPGWDDHMDDLGLDTPSLVTLKRLLYLEGIAGNLATGDWEQLGEAARLPAFHHLFRWQRGSQYLLGRIWSSRDGKGRAHFPMIACAHILGPPAPAATQIEKALETLHQQCAATTDAEAVRQHLAQTLTDLRQAASEPDENPAEPPAPVDIGELPDLANFHRGQFRPRTDPRAQVARISDISNTAHRDLEFWQATLRERLDPNVPILLLTPLTSNSSWIDVIAGKPMPIDFFCLRAANLTTEGLA